MSREPETMLPFSRGKSRIRPTSTRYDNHSAPSLAYLPFLTGLSGYDRSVGDLFKLKRNRQPAVAEESLSSTDKLGIALQDGLEAENICRA